MAVALYGWALGVFVGIVIYFIMSPLSALSHAPDEME